MCLHDIWHCIRVHQCVLCVTDVGQNITEQNKPFRNTPDEIALEVLENIRLFSSFISSNSRRQPLIFLQIESKIEASFP